MNTKRFSTLPLLLMDHDEVTRIIDTSLPIIPEDNDFYREELISHVRLSRKNRTDRTTHVQSESHDIEIVTNKNEEEIIENNNSEDNDVVVEAIVEEVDTIDQNIADDIELTAGETNDDQEIGEEKVELVDEAIPQETVEEEAVEVLDVDDEEVYTYPKTTVDQLNNYIHDKTEFKWSFTFIDTNEEDVDDDGFDL